MKFREAIGAMLLMLLTEALWAMAGLWSYDAWIATHKAHFLKAIFGAAFFSGVGCFTALLLAVILVVGDE